MELAEQAKRLRKEKNIQNLRDVEKRKLFHERQADEMRKNIQLRIKAGTKSGSPLQLNKKRLEPLYYSNPLPDNSSGSKIRPFQTSKDESGRPNAMEMVLANQMAARKNQVVKRGGVLTDYRTARRLLDRRAEDVRNIEREDEGLPRVAGQPVILTADDTSSLQLNNLLTTLQGLISTGSFDNTILQRINLLPPLLFNVLPSYSMSDITELLDFIDDDIILELRNKVGGKTSISNILMDFFQNVRVFLQRISPFMRLDLQTKSTAIRRIGLEMFGRRRATARPLPRMERMPGQRGRPRRREPVDDDDDEDADLFADEFAREMPELVDGTPEELDTDDERIARAAFLQKDAGIDRLRGIYNKYFPGVTDTNILNSRIKMANAINKKFDVNIKLR